MTQKALSPDVSIILPIYKTPEDFLTKCVHSICDQTHKNIEIILVDDGSPDSCPILCDTFATQDTRIKVIHKKNAGVSAARNTGLDLASGFWISFVDPDDWLEPDMIEKSLIMAHEYTEKNASVPNVVMWDYIKEFGHISKPINFFGNCPLTITSKDELHKLHLLSLELTSGIGTVWAKLYRANFLKDNKLYSDTNLLRGQDVEYNFRVFQKIEGAVFFPAKTYHYRYDGNTVSTIFNKNAEDYTKQFLTALDNDIIQFKCDFQFLYKFYIRSIHSILATSVQYSFHKKNHNSFKQKKNAFLEFCSYPIFSKAIKVANYSDFSLPRKVALFCLKHRIIIGIWFIAKVRYIQHKVKQ